MGHGRDALGRVYVRHLRPADEHEWVYSALYNLPVLVSGVLTTLLAVALIKPMERLPKVE
jgi:hypothetical protein